MRPTYIPHTTIQNKDLTHGEIDVQERLQTILALRTCSAQVFIPSTEASIFKASASSCTKQSGLGLRAFFVTTESTTPGVKQAHLLENHLHEKLNNSAKHHRNDESHPAVQLLKDIVIRDGHEVNFHGSKSVSSRRC